MRKKGFLTMGYGNMTLSQFMHIIKQRRINCIVDVRTTPYSKYNLAFNKEELRAKLNEENISYFWFGKKLGGRYDKISLCDLDGTVNYEKVAKTNLFQNGIEELLKLCDRYNVCILCYERSPLMCHRFLLVSRALKNYNIYHIMENGSLKKNSDLEQEMFKLNGNLNQISIFEEDNNDTFENRAYRQMCKKVAYKSQKVIDLLNQGVTEDLPYRSHVYTIGTKGKSAENFFSLLKDYKVKKIVDTRPNLYYHSDSFEAPAHMKYFLRLNEIEYVRIDELCVNPDLRRKRESISFKKFISEYQKQIEDSDELKKLVLDDIEGVCFLAEKADYKKCYRGTITKELKKYVSNLVVRHLR